MKRVMMAVLAASALVSVSAQADGEATYNKYCMSCHATGVGPMAHKADVWQPRLDAKGGLAGLVESAKKGMNAMPPMGMCMDCSDDDLKAAIEFMLTAK